MKRILVLILIAISFVLINAQDFTKETKEQRDARMEWWREARFGMFIHWGLYAIPAGEWGTNTNYAEWIRTQAEIPLDIYDKLVNQFNPIKFNADDWVRMAKDVGMKYIVITSKHHDGFCLFDSKYTDYDIMSTPFKRDILKELSEACKKEGIKLCFYHSIMDWHHPDYLPRRDWEKDRSVEGADFERYVQHLKNQLKELVTNYGEVGVLWFDGEWENTWSDQRGKDLYNYVRSIQPSIIINNRVSSSRAGMEGFTAEGGFAGDFGTPEQQIPATGLPGVDWESCMTMNNYWGYNKNDKNFKSTKEILQMLADIASKGGNYLLNVGPTAEGLFPDESIERLHEMGEWMKVNGESIYGTSESPFNKLEWGKCTQKNFGNNTRLYLHVFNWPADGKLVVPGIYNEAIQSHLLADESKNALYVERNEEALVISVPVKAPDEINSVVVLDVKGKADVNNPPVIGFDTDIFIESLNVKLKHDRENVEIRYTLDGRQPTVESNLSDGAVTISNSAVVSARCFREGKPVSSTSQMEFKKVIPFESLKLDNPKQGIKNRYFEGDWESLPDFNSLQQVEENITNNITITPSKVSNGFGFEYTGYIYVPEDGIYTFYTASDDGSRLYIHDQMIVDNDGQHGIVEKSGMIALSAGYHPIRVTYFEKAGDEDLKIFYRGPGIKKQQIPDEVLFY